MFTVSLDDGKYEVTNDCGVLTAKRYGETWPAANSSLCGDSLSLAMMHRIEQLEEVAYGAKRICDCILNNSPESSELDSMALELGHHPLVLNCKPHAI